MGQTSYQILLPESLKQEVLNQMHDSPAGGHLGIDKTACKIKERYYWVGCTADVRNYCLKCRICQQRKGPIPKQKAPLQIVNAGAPFERIAIDVLGPLPATQDGHRYILVIMDYFTRWPEAVPMKDQAAETVADALINHVFSRFGLCRELHSDQGRNFESEVFQKVLQKFRVDKTRTTALHPQSDGLVERFNRTTLDYLSKFVAEHQKDWDSYLPFLLLSLRSAVQQSTQQTPAMLNFGRELRLPVELFTGSPPNRETSTVHEYLQNLQGKLDTIYEFNRAQLSKASRRMKDYYDVSSRAKPFKVGDVVWLYNPKRRKGKSPKLQRDWDGPCEVIAEVTDVVYKIKHQGTSRTLTVHRDRLAPLR